MVHALRTFMEFCYTVRQAVIWESDIRRLQQYLKDFHQYRQVFINAGIRANFNLPRQHSIVHYPNRITDFGAPNGLCSSITESKHIQAVKEPYRRTNHHNELGQMLMINQRNDKLLAAYTDFVDRGMLHPKDPFQNILPAPSNQPCERPNNHMDISTASDAPQLLAEVQLCKTKGVCALCFFTCVTNKVVGI